MTVYPSAITLGDYVNVYVIAIILGIIEGLTEFLPVSSTGHLIVFQNYLGLDLPPDGKVAFTIMIQLGAILALILVYFRKLFSTLIGLGFDPASRRFALSVVLAFLPAALAGALLYKYIRALLDSTILVAWALIIGGVVILIVEQMQKRVLYREADRLPLRTSFLIGIGQTISMIPGVSRSGATIITALLLGVERRAAAEFSFFLSIPTMTGAFVFSAYKNRGDLTFDNATVIAVGFIAAFLSALVVVKPFLAIISRYGFAPFAYYRIALGTFVLVLAQFG